MERWVCPLSGVIDATGNITQLYPANCTAGVDPATATNGQLIRQPTDGIMHNLQIQTDGTNPGYLEVWDFSGIEAGINVSSAAVITQTQMAAAITAGLARLIYSQNFTAEPETPINLSYAPFQKGLAARFNSGMSAVGTINLNLTVSNGYRKTVKVG